MSRPRSVWILALGLSSLMSGGLALADDGRSAAPQVPEPEASPRPAAQADVSSSSQQSVKERAKALVMKATDAALADRWLEAEALFRDAWALEQTFDIAGNLGHFELKNGKPREAAEHLRFCLRALPPSETDTQRIRVQERLDEAKKQIAAIVIDVSVIGAEVTVDGRSVGTSPLEGDVFVEPGSHRVRVTRTGFDAAEQIVQTEKGGSSAVTISLSPTIQRSLPPTRTPPSSSTAAIPLAASGRSSAAPARESTSFFHGLKPGILAGGGALVASSIALGIGLATVSTTHETDATLLRERLDRKNGPAACHDDKELANDCADLASATNDGAAMSIGSKVAFGVAGAALAGTIAYVIFGRSSVDLGKGTTVLPSVTGHAGALLITRVW